MALTKTTIINRKTKHTGNTPENILKYEKQGEGGKKMGEVSTAMQPVTDYGTFKGLAKTGASVMLGLAGTRAVSGLIASRIPVNLPVVSNRTMGGVASTILMFYAHKKVNQKMLKSILYYGTAGGAIYTAGSILADVVVASGVELPPIVYGVLSATTGAPMMTAEQSE